MKKDEFWNNICCVFVKQHLESKEKTQLIENLGFDINKPIQVEEADFSNGIIGDTDLLFGGNDDILIMSSDFVFDLTSDQTSPIEKKIINELPNATIIACTLINDECFYAFSIIEKGIKKRFKSYSHESGIMESGTITNEEILINNNADLQRQLREGIDKYFGDKKNEWWESELEFAKGQENVYEILKRIMGYRIDQIVESEIFPLLDTFKCYLRAN